MNWQNLKYPLIGLKKRKVKFDSYGAIFKKYLAEAKRPRERTKP